MVRRGRREHVFATTPCICSNPQEVQTAELGCHAVGQVTEFPNLSLSVVRLEPGLSESASRRVQPVEGLAGPPTKSVRGASLARN